MSNAIPESIKSYKIEKETYKLSTINLYTATNTDINEKVLIHIFPKEKLLTTANEFTFMNNQVYLMKILNHKNILQLYEIIETKTHTFLIYEYFNGMKLSDYIVKKKKLTEEESLKIFKELLSTLTYLKEMFMCNLNINSHNILIDSNNNIKLCDFKFGHFYSPNEKSKSKLIGDYFSACPELHSKKPYNPELADNWSAGILLYQMLAGNLPFKSQKDLELIRLIIRGDYSMPSSLSTNMKNLIKGLLENKEEKRLKLNDIFNHPIIKEKKITKASLLQGLNILTTKYPIDEIAIKIFKNNLNIEEDILKKNLENNKFNEITSLFKQIISKLKMKGIPNVNDLSSDKFIAYVNDNKNLLKEEEQINNIQNYLKKEDEIKKQSEDIVAILLNNQNEILKGLQDLKRQYDRAKKGIRPLKRHRSFGNTKNKKKKLFDFEGDKKNIEKNENDKIHSIKRNTAIYQDIGKIYFDKEDKKEKKIQKIEEQPNEEMNKDNKDNKNNNENKETDNKNINNEEEKKDNVNIPKVEKKQPQTKAKKEDKKLNLKEQLKAVQLNKIAMKNQLNNNLKSKINSKKEGTEKDTNNLKEKKGLKNDNVKKINNNEKETKPQVHKKVDPKAGGFKSMKEMLEQKMMRQKIMKNDN